MKRLFWGLVLLWASGCTCAKSPGLDNPYACKSQDDCASGYVCLHGECVAIPSDGGCKLEGSGTEVCDDRIDNDCNLLVDCQDPVCNGQRCGPGKLCVGTVCACSPDAGSSAPPTETNCGDGIDDDCDGFTDCEDRDCDRQACNAYGRSCVAQQCTCFVDGGTAQQDKETLCNDGIDNDCNGATDCADTNCLRASCGANGRQCQSDGTCQCSGNGGAPEPSREVSCSDGFDNDCDGLVDCADPDCANVGCFNASGGTPDAGFKCNSAGACVCGGNSGTAENPETTCGDGIDNDCNGLTDCADPNCIGRACAANGNICQGSQCICGGNGGTAEATETTCNDGKDNDCNGKIDCADSACNNQTCGPNGMACAGTVCKCSGNGAPPESPETSCGDGRDNDCNGKVDCADSACNGKSCGTGCQCVGTSKVETNCTDGLDNDGDGNADCADPDCNIQSCGSGCTCATTRAVETNCADGSDNDKDSLTDCDDSDCLGRSCGAGCVCGQAKKTETNCTDGVDNDGDTLVDAADPDCAEVLGTGSGYEICSNGTDDNGNLAVDCADTSWCNGHVCGTGCVCSSTAKVETACSDGTDNDGNGLTDCADPACAGQSCGANGKTCSNGACICPATGLPATVTETSCGDGLDNDCDGLVDCNDPDCLHKSCGDATRPSAICCGTGSNASVCKDLDQNGNCGACGQICSKGCVPVTTTGGIHTGACACTGQSNGCPNSQTCSGGACVCGSSAQCLGGATCSGSPSVCHY